MCVTICGRFCPDEGVVAGYGNRIWTKYTAKWGVQIAGMIFQTRSSSPIKKTRIYRLIASAIDSGFACQTVTIRVFSIDEIIITKLQKYVNPLFYFVKNRYCISVLLCVLSDIFTFYPVFLYFFFSAIKRQIVYSTLFRDSTISIFFNF